MRGASGVDFGRRSPGIALANPLSMRLLSLVAVVTACNVPAAVGVVPASTDGSIADQAAPAGHDLATSPDQPGSDLSSVADLAQPPGTDLASIALRPDLSAAPPDLGGRIFDLAPAVSPDGGSFMNTGGDDTPLAHAPPSPMTGARTLLAGQN